MKLFEASELLQEAREDHIAKSMGPKLMSAYQQDRSGPGNVDINEPIDLVKHISKQTDPKAIQWLTRQYVKGAFKLEDLPRIKGDLKEFNRVKKKLEIKDLNQYKTLGDLYRAVEPHKKVEVSSKRQQDKAAYMQLFQDGDAELFYNGETLSVVIPKTKKASCELGKGTKWCTAATGSIDPDDIDQQDLVDSDGEPDIHGEYIETPDGDVVHVDDYDTNMFDRYNEDGPLYIVRIKGKGGKKYQFHFPSRSFMDEVDQEINVRELADKYPELYDAFEDLAKKHGYSPLIRQITPQMEIDMINKRPMSIKNLPNPTFPTWKLAVKLDPMNVYPILHKKKKQFTKEQLNELRMIAINATPTGQVIRFFQQAATPEMQKLAFSKSPSNIQFIASPTVDMVMSVAKDKPVSLLNFKNLPPAKEFTSDQLDYLVAQQPYLITNVPQTEQRAFNAVTKSGTTLQNIDKKLRTPRVCAAAVRNYEDGMMWVPDNVRSDSKFRVQTVLDNPLVFKMFREDEQTDDVIHALGKVKPDLLYMVKDVKKRSAAVDQYSKRAGQTNQ